MASLLKILSSEYGNEYKVKQYKTPKIYHGGKSFDLSKRWYVYYSYINPDTGKFVRQPAIYKKINQLYKTKKERLIHLKALRTALENLLKRGYSPYEVDIENNKNVFSSLDHALTVKKTEVKETTYKDYYNRIGLFKEYLIKKGYRYSNMSDIDKKCINYFLNTIPGAKNRNNTKAVLSSIFSVLADQDIIKYNFIKDIRNKKTKDIQVKLHPENVIKKAINLLEKQDKTLLMYINFVSYMFYRPLECVRLEIKNIDFYKNTISVQTKARSNKIKLIPNIIKEDIIDFIADRKGKVFELNAKSNIDKRGYLTSRFRKFRIKNKLPNDLTPYSFRHYYVTKVYLELRKEYNIEDTIKQLSLITGHDSKAIKHYIHVNDLELPEDYSDLLKR